MRVQDLRHAVRVLWKSRAFSLAAIVTLALGIGVNAAVFILYDAALYESLPATRPSELYRVITWAQQGGDHFDFSYPLYVDLREAPGAHDGLAAYTTDSVAVAAAGHSERVTVEYVTANYFDVLGISPSAGPGFSGRDELAGAAPVAMLSHALWRRTFGAAPETMGRTLNVNGREFTIVGVAPPNFEGLVRGQRAELWIPVSQATDAAAMARPTRSWLNLLARVQSGPRRSAEQLTSVFRATSPDPAANQYEVRLIEASRGDSSLVLGLEAPLRLLMITVGLILVIACANVANLLLARAHGRVREIAIRRAIGATRRRIIQQLLAESVVLAGAGGALGLLLAFWLVAVFELRPSAAALPLTLRLEPNALVLLFTAALSVCAALAAGLLPAFATSRGDLLSIIRRSDDGARSTQTMARSRQLLAVVQIALCLMLMIGAGLFLRSLSRVRSIDPSLITDRVIAATVNLELRGYDQNRGQLLYDDLLRRVRATPGVQSAALAYVLPVTGGGMRNNLGPRQTTPAVDTKIEYDMVPITDGFFETVGVPLLRGRDFRHEAPDARRVAIVNETFAHKFWPGTDALGQQFSVAGSDSYEIVGVARDTKYRNLREPSRMTMYLPLSQEHKGTVQLVVRTPLPPSRTSETLREAMRQSDPELPLYGVRTLAQHVDRSIYLDRLRASLISALAALALAIAAVGVYGLVSFGVAERTREVGIRMALGATPGEVLRMLLASGGRVAIWGVLAGGLLAMWGTQQASSALYGITRLDALSWLGAAAVLVVVVLLATLVPALRATRIDPMNALRLE